MLPKLKYKVSEDCWIQIAYMDDLQPGVVVAEFVVGNDPTTYYIIEMRDNEYPHFEVRDALLMTPDQDTPFPVVGAAASKRAPGSGVN